MKPLTWPPFGNLPVIYVIENNQYAMGTSVERSSALPELYKRGEAYGIPGYIVDGMDVLAVRDAALKATEYVRQGNGPVLLEVKTYRYRGHSMSDPGKYRTKEEVDTMKENSDPIDNARHLLEQSFGMKEDAFKAIDKKIKEIMVETMEFAETSPEPDEAELFTDVYLNPIESGEDYNINSNVRRN